MQAADANTPPRPPNHGPEPAGRADPRQALGRRGELLAAEHLRRLGFSPLGRNERTRYGEIDLIAFDGRTLIFAEVKTRRVDVRRRGEGPRPDQQPLVWLRPRQRIRLRKLATAWLADEQHIRPSAHTIRFDAIGVTLDSKYRLLALDHIEGAW
jgi:putative endonuclease